MPHNNPYDPQDGNPFWQEEEDTDNGYDPFAELETRESARDRADEWKAKRMEQ